MSPCPGKQPACGCRRRKRCGFSTWVGKIPGGGNGNPLQYSCLENSKDRGACWASQSTESQRVGYDWIHTNTKHALLPWARIKPMSLVLKFRLLTTGTPGKSPNIFYCFCISSTSSFQSMSLYQGNAKE